MDEIKQERTEAVAKAIEVAPEIARMNARKTINIEPQIFNEALKKLDVPENSTTTKGHNSALNDSDSQFSDFKSQRRTKSTGSI